MGRRSQYHKEEVHGYHPPPGPAPMTINPDTATIAAAGATDRVVCTLSGTGGQPPYNWSIANLGGMSVYIINTNQLATSANPCGPVGQSTVQIRQYDDNGESVVEPIVITVT